MKIAIGAPERKGRAKARTSLEMRERAMSPRGEPEWAGGDVMRREVRRAAALRGSFAVEV